MKIKCTLVLLCLAGLSGFAQADTRLLVNCFWPPKHHVCTTELPKWIDSVEQATDGRVRGVIPPKSVAPPPEQYAAVEKGIFDVGIVFNGFIGNKIKGPLVAMQPFVGVYDAAAMSQALWETNQKFFADEFKDVTLLSQFVISPGQLFSQTDTPLTSFEDFASRKLWALPGPLSAISKAAGSGVVSSPAAGSNEIISRGVVDGFFGLDAQAVTAFQLLPYAKSMTQFKGAVYTTSFSMFINNDKWSEISADDQAAIMSVSGSVVGGEFGAGWDAQNDAAMIVLEEKGVSVVDADPAFEQKLMEGGLPITQKWLADATAAGFDGAAALEFYKARVAELAK